MEVLKIICQMNKIFSTLLVVHITHLLPLFFGQQLSPHQVDRPSFLTFLTLLCMPQTLVTNPLFGHRLL